MFLVGRMVKPFMGKLVYISFGTYGSFAPLVPGCADRSPPFMSGSGEVGRLTPRRGGCVMNCGGGDELTDICEETGHSH